MKYFFATLRIFIFMSFIFHTLIILGPAIDEIGVFSVAIHAVLMTISWMLFFATFEIYKE